MTDINEIYAVEWPDLLDGEILVDIPNFAPGQAFDLTQGRYRPARPLVALPEDDGVVRDRLHAGYANFYLLKSTVFDALRQAGVSGFASIPIDTSRLRNLDAPFEALVVTGRIGALDYSRCRPATRRVFRSAPAHEVKVGAPFDLSTWDGAGIFMPEEKGHIWVTAGVKAVLQTVAPTIGFERADNVIYTSWS